MVRHNFSRGLFVGLLLFLLFLSHYGIASNQLLKKSVLATDYLENINASTQGSNCKISWNLKYDKIPLKGKLYIRYLEKNLVRLNKNPGWRLSDGLLATTTSFQLKNLYGGIQIEYSVGVWLDKQKEIIWSENKTFHTERGWTIGKGLIMRLFMLFGSLALFIYGMKTMSEGIQKAAGQRLRQILGSITSNKLKGILTGFVTTSIIQSSSATTVMVVSFVNAGLLNLKQSISVIMGANIGTTITAWLVAYFGFSLSMSDYALPLFLFALILLFSNNGRLKSWGEMLAGFALLFIGLELLKSGVPDIDYTAESFLFLKELSGNGILSVITFVIIGTLITIVVQSSSAAMAVTILLCQRGIIPFEMAAGMVLGENIGTTITANLAAIVANVHAKRAARSHFVFNVFGVIWMVIVFPYYINLIDSLTVWMNYASPKLSADSRPIALALFHSGFNILNVIILVGFTNTLSKIVIKMVPSKGQGDEDFKLDYIAGGVLSTPELSLMEVKKEIGKFADITMKMSELFKQLLFEKEQKNKKRISEKILKFENITDNLREEILNYLSKCAEDELSSDSQFKVRAYMAINNDLERIGNIYYQMALIYEKKELEKVWFSPDQRNNIHEMLKMLDNAFVIMNHNLKVQENKIDLAEALKHEKAINNLRDELRKENEVLLDTENFNVKKNLFYTDLVFSCERIGDLIINVSRELSTKK